ncbi:hypothetical protein ACFYT3_12595 [Nocardia amikacinitolerans]|uniref:hypothetical protein n=1 Tax=Nocardia amikacinitolerans TaxID=756689 RepID=UPI00369C3EF2
MPQPLSPSRLHWHRDDFGRAQVAALAALNQAGRACSARDLAGDCRIGPITLTLQWLITRGYVCSEVAHTPGAERPQPLYELTDEGREIHQRLTTHTPAARPLQGPEPRK